MQAVFLALILLGAAVLRLTGLDWDSYNHYHPDERYITWVGTTIEWPQDWSGALDPVRSGLNPFYWPADAVSEGIVVEQGEPRRFAYGHLPLYLGVAFTRLLERLGPAVGPRLPEDWLLTQDLLNQAGWIEFRHLTAASRALTALVDVGTVALLFWLGRRLYGPAVGLLAAGFLAVNVMHIQLAHFFTSDPYLTFFTVAAVLFMILAVTQPESGHRRIFWTMLAAMTVGLAVGSKFGGTLLLLPLAVAIWLDRERPARQRGLWLAAAGLVSALTFVVTNPFAVLDWNCQALTPALQIGPARIPALSWGSCYLQNLALQGTMVQGVRDVPFVRQYIGTMPYLYFIEMQLRWGMGPLLGVVAFVGFGWAVGKRVIGDWRLEIRDWRFQSLISNLRMNNPAGWVVLAWTAPFFVSTGDLQVKFMRYLQPLTPFLMLYGAAMILSWRQALGRRVAAGVVLGGTALYALAFVKIYSQPHPWITASRWFYDNVPQGATIVNETWDDPLPDSLAVAEGVRRRTEFNTGEVNWLTGTEEADDEDKLASNLVALAGADYMVLASNRNYGVIPRLPERYPLSSQYYPLLFDGRLGFEVVYAGTRTPSLFGLHLKPDTFGWPGLRPPPAVAEYLDSLAGPNLGRADESFTVYDQPLVIILENRGRLTVEEMRALFE
ncbi:MAG: phospholipid carrier-dependent glycosyltransferase [Chloroflexi bacterium]|nr:phospholipid carrier-dependent glycosyltransferase [Chloroflexota bacterium]MCI0648531.1 phospholipid carrier-dependent glycosyltransferase [Chloroflexota bacterium]MCI0728489.1 phospholipid carrier-dependent glycosyltransferase [Chloroflexota bacterium]